MSEAENRYRKAVQTLDDLTYKLLDEPGFMDLDKKVTWLQEWGCQAFGHEWIYDQCGYWQHQYCLHCGGSKYDHLAGKRCGELDKEMGKITEDQYLELRQELADA